MVANVWLAAALALVPPFPGQPEVKAPREARPHTFTRAATLILPMEERIRPPSRTFRSVALRMPFVYVLDREGALFVFKVPNKGKTDGLKAEKVLEDVGDGNDLAVLDDVLLCPRWGHLEVYSLEDPQTPKHLGKFGPDGRYYHTQDLIVHGDHAFLVGREGVVSYDVSDPASPQFLGVARSDRYGWTACITGDYLYVGSIEAGPEGGQGIAIFNVADPANIKEVSFVPTTRAPYHLFALREGRLLVSFDADSRIQRGRKVHGNSAVFDISNPEEPQLVFEQSDSGGRAATVLAIGEKEYFVCNGAIFSIRADELKTATTFSRLPPFGSGFLFGGSTLDGAPYHGDSDGIHAALALDSVAVVIRVSSH